MSAVPETSGDEGVEASGRRWAFATAEFDERSQELRVNGQPVELEPKFLEVLRHLLHHAGEILTKKELLEGVWPGRFVSDNSLPKAISRIREVLGDEDQSVIKTVHGYGYRLIAPVKVHASKASPALTRLDLREGQHPPLRPNWTLVRQLGSGGQGEVWLVRQDKVNEERVFKFALDVAGLAAIKREITLYRLLQEALPGHDEFTRVLDWNLEEAPYYIELEFGAGGNLESWAERMGELANIPLPMRLEVVARIADALAAAHSVGVLHKDLKPSNVLVGDEHDGAPRVKLADFGSGGVLDPQRLEVLGITRLGFTRSVLAGEAGATATYLAPEVVAGQPVTVQGDIYSLGIMLYQVVVADLRQPLASGWERRVGDELLCEDIAQAVAGEPSRRLSDASALAARLRTLEQRRALREAERAEEQRRIAEQREVNERVRQAELAVERLRTRRNWTLTVLSVLIVGMALSLALYLDARRARNEAAAAAAASQAVADYLSRDLFAQVGTKPLRDLTVAELVESAAASLDQRAKDLPQVSAQLHAALGNAAMAVDRYDLALHQLEQSFTTFEANGTASSEAGLEVASRYLMLLKGRISELPAALPRFERILKQGRARLGDNHPRIFQLRGHLAAARFYVGDWPRAASDTRSLIEDQLKAAQPMDVVAMQQARLGQVLNYLSHFAEAETVIREALRTLQSEPSSHTLSQAETRLHLAVTLANTNRFKAAHEEVRRAEILIRPWTVDEESASFASVRAIGGLVSLRERDWSRAVKNLERVVRQLETSGTSFDMSGEYRSWLASAYAGSGRRDDALSQARRALKIAVGSFGPKHPSTLHIRIELAELLTTVDQAEARSVLSVVDEAVVEALGPDHLYLRDLRRVQHLLREKRP